MPRLTAIKEHRYGGLQRFPGDEFDASEKDARLLIAVKRAALVAHHDRPQKQAPVETKKQEASPAAPLSEHGQYQRRDMRAEDGRTGEEKSPSSSRAAPAPKEQTSAKPGPAAKPSAGSPSRKT